MTLLRRLLCPSTAAVLALVGIFLLNRTFVTCSSDCSEYELTCENGECIDPVLWCDTEEHCTDGSDEKYCKKANPWFPNPNKCPSEYFRCSNGICIPMIGRCDGYDTCEDASDEDNCDSFHTTTSTTFLPPNTQMEGSKEALFFASLNSSPNSMHAMTFSGLRFSEFSEQRNKARKWILSQRKDYGWGDETSRSITALCLSDQQPILRHTESNLLMIKQLEMQLSLELSRNESKPVKLTDLALYINALLVSCKDPKNFYGDNIVSILREGANAAHKEGTFVNPSIYMTLCFNNATTFDDTKKLRDIFLNWNSTAGKLDIQSLALLATACIFKKTNYLNASMYDIIQIEFLRTVKSHGFPGNVYAAALLFQALQELKITLVGLKDFILKQQQDEGSFGDILSTYLVLPILAGRNLVQMNDYCGQRNTPDLIPLEVLKNVKSKKIHVQYSLNYGVPPEVTQTLQMHVAKGINFLDFMRLAQEISPKYRFKLSENREVPVIYSVGELPNDAEKGMYWTLYIASGNSTEITSEENWVPYYGDIKKLILVDGDKMLFWYRPV